MKRDIEDQYRIYITGDKDSQGRYVIFKEHIDGKKTTLEKINNKQEAEKRFRELSKDFFAYLVEKYSHV